MSDEERKTPPHYLGRRYCPITNCVHSLGTACRNSGVKFFRLPTTDLVAREQWIRNMHGHHKHSYIGALTHNKGHLYICELHFELADIIKRPGSSKELTLRKGAVPTIFPSTDEYKRIQQLSQLSDPLSGSCPVSSTRTTNRQPRLLCCKQCVRVDVALMEAKTKLFRLNKKWERKTRKRRKKQCRSSELIPERITDSSKNNQNYIPQNASSNRKAIGGDCDAKGHSEESYPPSEQIATVDVGDRNDVMANEEDDATDDDPPNCEREQFAEYIMTSISALPEQSAVQAMAAIKVFLGIWTGFESHEVQPKN